MFREMITNTWLSQQYELEQMMDVEKALDVFGLCGSKHRRAKGSSQCPDRYIDQIPKGYITVGGCFFSPYSPPPQHSLYALGGRGYNVKVSSLSSNCDSVSRCLCFFLPEKSQMSANLFLNHREYNLRFQQYFLNHGFFRGIFVVSISLRIWCSHVLQGVVIFCMYQSKVELQPCVAG